MKNLAGCKDSDRWCEEELTIARIRIERVEKPYGEPQTRIVGRLGSVTFERLWYYWSAKGRVPLDVARRLYTDPLGKRDVRVAGHCGCPPPDAPWVDWFDGDEEVVIDPDGKQEAEYDGFVARGSLPAEGKPRFAKSADGLQGYVTCYHIDSEAGLRLFADAMRDRPSPDVAAMLEEVARLDAAATDGPWDDVRVGRLGDGEAGSHEEQMCNAAGVGIVIMTHDGSEEAVANTIFMARARTLLPKLAAEVTALRAEREGAIAIMAAMLDGKDAEIEALREKARAVLAARDEMAEEGGIITGCSTASLLAFNAAALDLREEAAKP